ncbi:MAG: sporulation integral membrane protein YtvI [Clostridia bacterium]|nr:sporulation integral membrane protein YtvI [Clostridia bacterium]
MENPLLSTEKKKKTIINILYYALLLTLFYCFMKYAFGLFFPFILAFIVAMIMQRPINFISKKTKIKKGVVSGIMILLLVAIIGFLVSLLGVKIWEAFRDFLDFLMRKFGDLPNFLDKLEIWVADRIRFLPDSVESSINSSLSDAVDRLKELLTSPDAGTLLQDTVGSLKISSVLEKVDLSALSSSISGVWYTAKQIPTIFLAIIVSIFACCFMASDYDRLTEFVKRQFSSKSENFSKAKRIVTISFKNLIKAYALIILVTFVEMLLGLSALKLFGIYKGSWIVFIAMGTAVVDIMPVLGTGTILLPWSLYSFISGDIPMGIGVLVLYVFITVMRQFIEPKLVAGQLGLPPFVTIMGMYIGLKLFGIIGMFAVPLTIILIKLLNDEGVIHIWKTGKEEEQTEEIEINNDGGNENESTEKV